MNDPTERRSSYYLIEWTWRDDRSLAFAQAQRYDDAELAEQNRAHRMNHSEIDTNHTLLVVGKFGDVHGATHASQSLFAQECLKQFLSALATSSPTIANPDNFTLLPIIV